MLTIARFSKPEEAHLMRLRLEAGGVAAYILDENTIQMDWLYSNAIGGVRLQIAEEDVESAKEILEMPPVEKDSEDAPTCPRCASHKTAPDELPRRLSFLTLLLAGFPFPISRARWRCSECRQVWKPPTESRRADKGS